MEENKPRGLIIVGASGVGKTSLAELVNAVIIENEGQAILMDKENLPAYKEKMIIKAPPILENSIIEINTRGVIPPNYYKKRRK